MAEDKIINHIYIKGNLTLTSPLIMGGGDNRNSDIDIIRDWEGNPFIPGSSITGAIRHHMDEILVRDSDGQENEIIRILLGEREKDSKLSLITFHDVFPCDQSYTINIRDGVAIDNIKRVAKAEEHAKFDYEIIEPGAKFNFKCEVIIREKHRNSIPQIKNLIYLILDALKNEKISFGAKTRRGFGKVRLDELKIMALNLPEDAKKWLEFEWNNFTKIEELSNFPRDILTTHNNITKIKANFSIPYSILIRHYTDNPADPDSVHLTSCRQAIIPGTSWAGVIRHTIENIGRTIINKSKVEEIIDQMFGNEKTHASRVYINESIIHGGESISYTRNKVDRFSGGVVDSALFDEKPHYNGNVTLDINIKGSALLEITNESITNLKSEIPADKAKDLQPLMYNRFSLKKLNDSLNKLHFTKEEIKVVANHAKDGLDYEIGLILLALKDIGNGVSPVGGGGNIGKGILEMGEISINDTIFNWDSNSKYLKALAEKIKEAGLDVREDNKEKVLDRG